MEIDVIRESVLEHLASRSGTSFAAVATQSGVAPELLAQRFGTVDRLIDEVVAGVLHRARPVVGQSIGYDGDTQRLISDLVRRRLLVDESLDVIWHFIGQGEASAQEFAALRSTLLADVEHRMGEPVGHLAVADRIEAIRIIDGALSLAAVRSLRKDCLTTFSEASARLVSQLETLFVALRIVDAPPPIGHLRLVP